MADQSSGTRAPLSAAVVPRAVCSRCQDDRPLCHIYYRLDGKNRRTKALCFACRHRARRMLWRAGAVVGRTESLIG